MDLLIRGCGALGVSTAMRASHAGLAVTLMAEDPFDAERLASGLRGYQIAIRAEAEGLPDVAAALAPPELLPAAPLRLALCDPGPDVPEGAAAVYIHGSLAEVSLFNMPSEDRQQVLSLLQKMGLPVIEAPAHATVFAGLVLLDRLAALADQLLLQGAVPWEVDEAMERFGFGTGVFSAQDIAGLDLAYARRRKTDAAPLLVTDRMVHEGRLGRGAGVGWYRYPGGGGAVIDPLMEDMAVEEARFASITQCGISDQETVERLLLGLACCGAELLARGEVADEARLDQICRRALSYPDNGPGVIRRVRDWGIEALKTRLQIYGRDRADLWAPQALLEVVD